MKSDPEAAESFSRYLKFWTEEQAKLNPREIEELAARKGAQVSNSKVNSAINGMYADHRMRTIEAIALAIGRPPEEVFLAALGYSPPLVEDPEFKESEAAHLWRLIAERPPGERKYYNRYIRMLMNEIQRSTKKE